MGPGKGEESKRKKAVQQDMPRIVGIVYCCWSWQLLAISTRTTPEENIHGALAAGSGVQRLGTMSKTCAEMTVACTRFGYDHHVFFAFAYDKGAGNCVLLTRQISRLETRIKECIRVESIMVRKPNNKSA